MDGSGLSAGRMRGLAGAVYEGGQEKPQAAWGGALAAWGQG